MPTNLLVFEDEAAQQQVWLNTFSKLIDSGKLKITYTDNLEEAENLLKDNFFDVSVIDLLIQHNQYLANGQDEEEEDYQSFFEEYDEDTQVFKVETKRDYDNLEISHLDIPDKYDGFALLDFIKNNKIPTRPIIFSGYYNYDTLAHAHEYGSLVYGFLKKTTTPNERRTTVKDALTKPLPFEKVYKRRNKSLNHPQCQTAVNQLLPAKRKDIAMNIAFDLPLNDLKELYEEVGRAYFLAEAAKRDPEADPLDFDLKRFSIDDIESLKRKYGNGCIEKRYTTKNSVRVVDGYFLKWHDEEGVRHRHRFPSNDHPYLLKYLPEHKPRKSDDPKSVPSK